MLLLAVAIGAATALTSIFLLSIRDLPPVEHPDGIVTIWQKSAFTLRGRTELNLDQFRHWIAPALAPALPTAIVDGRAVLRVDEPMLVAEQRVSENFFRLIGRGPQAGRVMTPEELSTDARVAMVSSRLSRRTFGGDARALDRTVLIDGRPYHIVGVMPDGFWFIFRRAVDLWRPVPLDSIRETTAIVTARLSTGARPSTLEAALSRPPSELSGHEPPEARAAVVQALSEEWTIRIGPGMIGLIGPALLILLIACANAANLLLIANSAREKEFGIRAALGASPARLLRQSAVETLWIVVAAAAGGVVLARAGHLLFLRALSSGRENSVPLDPQSWAVAAATMVMIAIALPAAGLMPAMSAARANVSAAFRETLRTPRFDRGKYGAFDLLLVLQVGLAVALVLMGTFLFGFMREWSHTAPNFDAQATLVLEAYAPAGSAATTLPGALAALERADAIAAGALSSMPPMPSGRRVAVRVADDRGERGCQVNPIRITSGYFAVLQLGDRDGRIKYPPLDTVVVSESAAAACWQSATIRNGQIRIDVAGGSSGWLPVHSVVKDAYKPNAVAKRTPEVYIVTENWTGSAAFLVRMRAGHDAREFRQVLRRAAADLPVGTSGTVQDLLAVELSQPRGAVIFVGILAALALLIAMTGVGAALHHAVTLRRVEFGVRIAVGATPARLIGAVVARDVPLLIAGEVAGILVTLASVRAYWPDLLAVSGKDPSVWGIACGVLVLSALLAGAVPIARAVRLDPVRLLRAE